MMNKKELELYIHIPFCARKCSYCDFLSFPIDQQAQREYSLKLIEEIRYQSARAKEYQVVSVFIGGGTPSILKSEYMAKVLCCIQENFQVLPDAEISMEVNPGTVTAEGLACYKEAGVNRISIGLQSADDQELRWLGRIHTYDEFLKSYQRVRMAGFGNVNVDLISAIPGQTLESWKNTLKKTAMLKPEHISAYSLIVEEGTPYYDRYGGWKPEEGRCGGQEEDSCLMSLPELPDEETEREMYYLTQQFLKEQGYERYEISNYSKQGYECRHNMGYWMGTEYLGFGLGASSYFEGCRFHNTPDFKEYCGAAFDREDMFQKVLRQDFEKLNIEQKMEEYMFLGLRLIEGISAQEFVSRFGHNIRNVYGQVLSEMEENGLMEWKDGYYRLTLRGIDISNYVMSRFLL